MRTSRNRRLIGAGVALAAVAAVGFIPTTVGAAPLGAGDPPTSGQTLSVTLGNSSTSVSLNLAAPNNVCPGDSTSDGYVWNTYMVPAAADPAILRYDSNGPLQTATGGSNPYSLTFAQPLFSTGGTPFAGATTGATTGLITPTAVFNFAVFPPGFVPAGEYKIGYSCSKAGLTERYWQTLITVTTDAATGGPAQISWQQGAKPVAPVLASPLTVGDNELSGSFSHTASDPATTVFTITAVPTTSGATVTKTVTSTGAFTLAAAGGTQTGSIVNGLAYSVTVVATNALGDSPDSNTVVSPVVNPSAYPGPVLTATSAVGEVELAWTTPPGTIVDYTITGTDASGPLTPITGVGASLNSYTVTPLAPGSYSFQITANYASPFTGNPSNVATASSNNAQTLIQDIEVDRPLGALVLTQRCGVYGSAPVYDDTSGANVFGVLPALPATPGADPTGGSYPTLPVGSAPTFPTLGGTSDPLFPQYPYPTDDPDTVGTIEYEARATYPTHCGIDLGTGTLITNGPRAGQYFKATGRIAQITVVNTQNVDNGWTLNGRMSQFTSSSDSFSGNLLGWDPEVTWDSAANLDGYDMVVNAGGVRQPEASSSATGLGAVANETNSSLALSLAKSPAFAAGTGTASDGDETGSLGMAVIDARLRLLIPVTADSGTYTGTLTFTTV